MFCVLMFVILSSCFKRMNQMSTPCFVDGKLDHKSVDAIVQCSRFQTINLACLMTYNTGTVQDTVAIDCGLACETLWCVNMAALISRLLARFMNQKLFFHPFCVLL